MIVWKIIFLLLSIHFVKTSLDSNFTVLIWKKKVKMRFKDSYIRHCLHIFLLLSFLELLLALTKLYSKGIQRRYSIAQSKYYLKKKNHFLTVQERMSVSDKERITMYARWHHIKQTNVERITLRRKYISKFLYAAN